jgi:hypothetical protein
LEVGTVGDQKKCGYPYHEICSGDKGDAAEWMALLLWAVEGEAVHGGLLEWGWGIRKEKGRG